MDFVGNYKLEKDDNFDEFLRAIDVPYLARKIAVTEPNMSISYIGEGRFRIKCNLMRFFKYCIEFKEGEEFEEKTATGEVVKKIITRDNDNRWIETQLNGKHSGLIYIREIDCDGHFSIVS